DQFLVNKMQCTFVPISGYHHGLVNKYKKHGSVWKHTAHPLGGFVILFRSRIGLRQLGESYPRSKRAIAAYRSPIGHNFTRVADWSVDNYAHFWEISR